MDSHNPQGRRWWLPSISVSIWLMLFLALSLSNWRQVMISADGDPCLHWGIGKWMIEHHEVVRAEHFSHTRLDAPLISKEWLSEISFAAVGNRLGWNGIVLVSAALIATTMWLLHRLLLAEGCEILLATGLVFAAAFACSTHWLARPHLVTHLLTVVFLWNLRGFDRDRYAGWRLFLLLPPLMLLWTNLHGAFPTGFVLMGAWLLGFCFDLHDHPARRQKPVVLAGVILVCLLVSLLNPNGWHLHAQILGFLRSTLVGRYVNEFRSPNFHSGGMRGFEVLLLSLGAVLLVIRPRIRRTDLVLMAVWGYFALDAARNVPIFALVLTPILAEHLNAYLKDAPVRGWAGTYRRFSQGITAMSRTGDGRIWVLISVIAVALWAPRTEPLPDRLPVAAVQWLKEHPEAVQGEMFNDYGWGGYLILELPERKVFVDGRNDFYGDDLIREFDVVNSVTPGWDRVLAKYHVGWTILPINHPLNQLLALRPDWSVVHADAVAVIYARQPRDRPTQRIASGSI